MKMTIADGLKYVNDLEDRLASIKRTIERTELTRTSSRIVSTTAETRVEEVTNFIISPKELLSELDETSKELRLVRQEIERKNHTIELEHIAKY